MSRRSFVAGTAGVAGASLTGAGLVAGSADAQAPAREAPDLAQAAQAGRIPPLAQRLPSRPMVVTPVERVGTYGGTMRRGLSGSSDHNGILRMIGNMGLTRWNMEMTDVLPNVAERWDVSADSSEFTFFLRPGMKWSDGQPFGADDLIFAFEDCLANNE